MEVYILVLLEWQGYNMDNLYYKTKLYLEANSKTEAEFDTNIILQNDGSGDYIHTWNVSGVAKPTDSQLNALSTNATKELNNAKVRSTRKSAYGDIGEQLDEIYKDIDAWKARIKKIKDDNPKE
jgi:hypothetical protein